MARKFTNIKIGDVPKWDLKRLQSTKEYQEKRKKFIEIRGGKCECCNSTEFLTVSHPQRYIRVFFNEKNGLFYGIENFIRWKEVCPACGFDEAYNNLVGYKRKTKHNKKWKIKYFCPNCGASYKYAKRIRVPYYQKIQNLPYFRKIPDDRRWRGIARELEMNANNALWLKYITFIDARIICRGCHYKEHFIPLKIKEESKQGLRHNWGQSEKPIKKSSKDLWHEPRYCR